MWRMCLTSFIIWLMINSSYVLGASVSPDIKYNGHEYKLFNDSMTWQQAKSYCESIGGHLMTITSQQEQEIAETLLRTRGVKNNYWLGGYRNGNAYIWITGEEFNYSHWALGEPNNAFGREYIVSMYKNRNPVTNCNNSGDWNDISDDGSCNNEPFFGSHNFGFICEWDTNVIIERDSYRAVNDKIITDGIYSLRPQCAPGKELSVENNSTNWGANVIIDSINSNWKKWKVQRIANTDYYSIIAVHSNLALDVANARAENGVNISTWPYLGGSQNQFKILYAGNGYYVIQANIGGNFVVDVLNAENRAGANVWSYGFNGTPAQLWKFIPIQRLPVFQPYSKRATQKVTAYVMPDLQARSGDEYVSAGDNVTVLREEGDAIFIRYPVRGGTKERWVNKNDIFSGSNLTPTSGTDNLRRGNIVQPMKNWYCTWRSHRNWGWGDYSYNSSHPERSWHLGLDVYGDNGYVYAMADGTVVSCSNSNSGGGANGRYIVIKHNNIGGRSCYSFYAHLASIKVSNNQSVQAGEHIAVAGGSGYGKDNYYGTHLHFAVVGQFSAGKYYGYATEFSGDSVTYEGTTFYNPRYVLQYKRLP